MAKGKTKRPRFEVGMITVYARRGPNKDGNYYWSARWRDIDNRRREPTLGWCSRDDAARAAANMLLHIEEEEARLQRGATLSIRSVRDLMESWWAWEAQRVESGQIRQSTADRYEWAAGYVVDVIGDVPIGAFNEGRVQDLIDVSLRKYSSAATALRIAVLRKAWKWAQERQYIPARHVKIRIRAKNERLIYTPSAAEVALVMEHLSGWQRGMYAIMAGTGMRPGEISVLRVADVRRVDDGHGFDHEIHIPDVEHAKTGHRIVPLLPWVVDELKPWLDDGRESSCHFFGKEPATLRNITTHISNACGPAGVPRFTAKSLRHYAATSFLNAGVSPKVAAKILGHSEVVMLQIYARATEADKGRGLAVALPRPTAGKVIEMRAHHKPTKE